jgi:hypothetical protein
MSLTDRKYRPNYDPKRPRTIAERGWLGSIVDEHLRVALEAAEQTLSDLDKMELCSGADCGRMFDTTDPRSAAIPHNGTTLLYCPGCEAEAAGFVYDQATDKTPKP